MTFVPISLQIQYGGGLETKPSIRFLGLPLFHIGGISSKLREQGRIPVRYSWAVFVLPSTTNYAVISYD